MSFGMGMGKEKGETEGLRDQMQEKIAWIHSSLIPGLNRVAGV